MTPEEIAEMKEVNAISDAMIEEWRKMGEGAKPVRLRRGMSSLHDTIRTKEQAERFMKSLRQAVQEAEAEAEAKARG